MTDETNEPAATTDDDAAERTRDGSARADHVTTGAQTRGALQKWGATSPGSNAIPVRRVSMSGSADAPHMKDDDVKVVVDLSS
jgi:hypothetical protein